MKGLKRITSIVLALAMFATGIAISGPTTVKADTATDNWKANGIVSPKQDKLIGAGYIDVKWDNTLTDVSQYKVYVDGDLKVTVSPTSDKTMSTEFYTTQVSEHNVYVVATLKNGTNVQTANRRFYVTKKGVCVNTKDMGTAVDPASMNVGWYYNWDWKSFKDMNFSNKKFDDLEFVPMIWGDSMTETREIFDNVKSKGYKYLLAYNEPDLKWESNVRPDVMQYRWNDCVNNKGNVRLGSPAVSVFPTWSNDWWTPFWNSMAADKKNAMSFIAVHSYQKSYDGAKSALQYLQAIDECWETYHKPIWITEFAFWKFSINDAAGCAKVQEFMKIVIKGLNERSYVERYSWFCPNIEEDAASSSSIFNYKTGELTTLGKIYAQIGNPSGDNAKTYGVGSYISTNTSPAACAVAMPTTLYSAKAKKKAFKYQIKAVSRAAGYQVQYGVKKNMKGSKSKYVKKLNGTIKIKFTKKQKKQIKKKKLKIITYYVRVRAYKTLDGKRLYCAWSSKDKVKVKTR